MGLKPIAFFVAISSGLIFGILWNSNSQGKSVRDVRAVFAEIRRALPSSYRESRKAVSTVVFGPAVSLERSTPLTRPRDTKHAENKNISPRLAVRARGERSWSRHMHINTDRSYPIDGSSDDTWIPFSGGDDERSRNRVAKFAFATMCEPPLNNAPEKLAAKVWASVVVRRHGKLLAYLTKSVM